MTINYQRASELLLETQQAMQCDEGERLGDSADKLLDALVGIVPWDWRYNATHWALDVIHICREIGFSVAWMRAFARYWSESKEPDRGSAESLVSYYADNAATRISSCRDKLALLAWSYYCPFNPDKKDEVLNFDEVRDRFANPLRFGLHLTGHDEFLAELNKLVGPDFSMATVYRHKKVHRIEPRVVMRRPEPCEQPSYMFPVVTEKEAREFDDRLKGMYPDDQMRATIRQACFLNGVLFDRRAPKELRWHFEKFDRFSFACWKRLCDATAGSCGILLLREPLLSKTSG
jgi:hypothetical protein